MIIALIDKKTDEVCCRGLLKDIFELDVSDKKIQMGSIDGKHFFKIEGGDRYKTEECEDSAETIEFHIPFCSEYIVLDPPTLTALNEPFDIIVIAPDCFIKDMTLRNAIDIHPARFFEDSSAGTVYEVTDNATGEVIARGRVVIEKTEHRSGISEIENGNVRLEEYDITPVKMISFDYRHFFWVNGNDKYSVRKITGDMPPEINYIERPDYKQVLWRNPASEILSADVIREFDIDECDPEIQGLVYALNKIPDVVTILSCCGHGRTCAWVAVCCKNINGFYRLMDILKDSTRKHFGKFYLDVSRTACRTSKGIGEIEGFERDLMQFAIATYYSGKEAYDDLKELENHINEIWSKGDTNA